MKTKNFKPRLTAKTVDLLRTLVSYAEAEADVLCDGTPDQVELATEVHAACDWVRKLADWHSRKI